jgi:hypothetical protein
MLIFLFLYRANYLLVFSSPFKLISYFVCFILYYCTTVNSPFFSTTFEFFFFFVFVFFITFMKKINFIKYYTFKNGWCGGKSSLKYYWLVWLISQFKKLFDIQPLPLLQCFQSFSLLSMFFTSK